MRSVDDEARERALPPDDHSIVQRWFEALATTIGVVQGIALCAIVLLILLTIVLRNFFDVGLVWVFEAAGFLMVTLVFLGIPKNLVRNEDITVDFVTSRLGRHARTGLWLLGRFIILGVSVVFVTYLIEHSARFGRLATPTLEIPHRLFYFSVLAGPLLAVFVTCWHLLLFLRKGRGRDRT